MRRGPAADSAGDELNEDAMEAAMKRRRFHIERSFDEMAVAEVSHFIAFGSAVFLEGEF
jgi:hypothetical protein